MFMEIFGYIIFLLFTIGGTFVGAIAILIGGFELTPMLKTKTEKLTSLFIVFVLYWAWTGVIELSPFSIAMK